MTLVAALNDLLFPLACAGCGKWDYNLCPDCELLLGADPEIRVVDDNVGDPVLPVYSLGTYGGPLRQLIISAKHQPGRDLKAELFQAGSHMAQAVAVVLEPATSVCVVPAPPSWRRYWDRQMVTTPVAEGMTAGLEELLPFASVRLRFSLRLRPGWGSQSKKSGDLRRQGRQGAFALVAEPPKRAAVVLVDDVLTTGATMLEMLRVLGSRVQVGAVLASA